MAHPIRIYSTLERKIVDFVPIEEGKVGLYICGVTVYDDAHIGHGRFLIIFDSFVRYLRSRGWEVKYVRNYTDVDDKIINRANEKGEDPFEFADKYIDAFRRDSDAMGLLLPDREPRVTQSIDIILDMIGKMVEKGHAYESEGSVWFNVRSYGEYGRLSGQKIDEMRSADEAKGKKDPADFALWKAVKPGEPSWESPWGAGRPGWHIECSAMALDCLGETIDIHGGGLDLVFPHHENEVAQSTCANGTHYARYWMHNGLLTMGGGQKMGKSLGNVINIEDALVAFPAEALRLYYLQNQYRSPLPWSADALPAALNMLSRMYDALEKGEQMGGEELAERVIKDLGEDAARVAELAAGFEERYHSALDEDFNTAQAMGVVFELARAVNRFANHKKAKKRGGPVVKGALAALRSLAPTLGLLQMDVSEFQEEVKVKRLAAMGLTRESIEEKIEARNQARIEKDWAKSDELRAELEAMRLVVMDTADGVSWRINLADDSDD
ncbi:MAG: cysteinyl-tRNA synthetase [Planctomycetota bacterium]